MILAGASIFSRFLDMISYRFGISIVNYVGFESLEFRVEPYTCRIRIALWI